MIRYLFADPKWNEYLSTIIRSSFMNEGTQQQNNTTVCETHTIQNAIGSSFCASLVQEHHFGEHGVHATWLFGSKEQSILLRHHPVHYKVLPDTTTDIWMHWCDCTCFVD